MLQRLLTCSAGTVPREALAALQPCYLARMDLPGRHPAYPVTLEVSTSSSGDELRLRLIAGGGQVLWQESLRSCGLTLEQIWTGQQP